MKKHKTLSLRYLLVSLLLISNIHAKYIIDVISEYGAINSDTIQKAANKAMSYRKQHKEIDVIIQLAEGTYKLDKEIEFSNFDIQGSGWIMLQGAGREKTRLIDTEYELEKSMPFRFESAYKFKISDMTLEGERLTHSQGTIVKINTYKIDIELDEGYPTPDEMYEIDSSKANKIRRILDSDLHPVAHYIEDPDTNEHQTQRWTFQGDFDRHGDDARRPEKVSGRTWRFFLQDTRNEHPFEVGDRVGVSSKSKRSNWGVFTDGGRDVTIENIDFLKLGRVKFRQEWHNLHFINNRIIRPTVNGIPSFYSTDAGPQVGHEKDGVDIYDLVFKNNDIRGTVDDASALQRISSGTIENNYWEDGGGVPLGVSSSDTVNMVNNTFYHSPLEDLRDDREHFQGAYQPEVIENQGMHVGLSWSKGLRTDHHEIRLGTQNPPPVWVKKVTKESYSFECSLKANTTYYWQVFEHNTEDNLGVNKSDVWTFTTGDKVKDNGEACNFSGTTAPVIVPDYIPTLSAKGTIFSDKGEIDILIRVAEMKGGLNNKGDLSFSIVKNRNINLVFDPLERTRQGKVLDNKLWEYKEESAYYLFTYIGTDRIFPKQSLSYIGLKANFEAAKNSKGKFDFDVTIVNGTGEKNRKNNKDSEIIQYSNM